MRLWDALTGEAGPLFLVGSCKNAGKTTVLNFLNGEFFGRLPNKRTSLLTIGRDGEPEDVVYRHPKPPVRLLPGNLFVTTKPLFDKLKSAVSFVQELGLPTALGDLVIGAAVREANVELIGPGNNAQLETALRQLKERHGSHLEIVDGSFDRRTQIAVAPDGRFILVVSADLATTPERAASWLAYQIELFDLPSLSPDDHVPGTKYGWSARPAADLGWWWRHGTTWDRNPTDAEAAFCRGPLTATMVDNALDDLDGKSLILEDATKVFFEEKHWRRLKRRCPSVHVEWPLRLVAVASNPQGIFRQFEAREFFETLAEVCGNRALFDAVSGLRREP
ncbi:MAG: hypothetical protein P9L99_16220 [Candidatus Lernaella stagnicola]|nr:hypothetical protein [Candidatus Lernaella stagnicola]